MAATMTAAALVDDATRMAPPDPEVPARPTRRRFTTEYKLRVLAETDAAPAGTIAAILRREGLYSSHLDAFRKQRDAGGLDGPRRKRGPMRNPLTAENAKLRRENERLRRDLENARLVIDVQKQVAKLLGIPLQTDEES
jgi:transposase-like protein